MHADPALGCGNFLDKVLAQDVDREGWLFELDFPWALPSGQRFERLSLTELGQAVTVLAAWYLAAGVKPGEVVLTYTNEGLSQFVHAISLISIGAIPSPVNCRMRPDITLLYYSKYGFDHLAVDEHPNLATLLTHINAQSAGQTISLLDARPCAAQTKEADIHCAPRHAFGTEDALIMLCHSSGTTGVPKAVMFGHQQFFVGKRDRLLHFLESEDDRMLSALPHSHSAGFSYLMTAVLLGLPTRVLSKLDGADVASETLRYQPTVMAGFPQTYAALAQANLPEGSLLALRRCYNTGDTAHEAHVRALLRAAPELRFHDGFGASELGMALFSSVSSRDGRIAGHRNVGRPVPFAKARIVDELLRPLPAGEIGYLAINSPTITSGYYRDPQLTARCRKADGDWLTGDIGYLDDDGAFVHLDRAVDIMMTPRGPAYSLALEEAVLRDIGIADVTVTGAPLTPLASQAVVAWLRLPSSEAPAICDRVLALLDGQLQRKLGGPVPVAVVNVDPAAPAAVGATGKALKRVLRDEFWSQLKAWEDRSETSLTHAVFLHG
ncbi:MAG: class I adenylate-forming enzyme family protein [Burkholderiaceae bacterium]